MTKISVNNLPEFDPAELLDSETAIASYLNEIISANDAGLLADALGTIARSRGMTQISSQAGIAREALYKALRPGSAPRFDTINKVCQALGMHLVVVPTSIDQSAAETHLAGA